MHHKVAHKKAIHHEAVSQTDYLYGPDYWPQAPSGAEAVVEPCTQYRKHNIIVTECPGTFYSNSDTNDNTYFESEGSYTGYYPKVAGEEKTMGPEAPQRNTNEGNLIAPAGGNEFHNPTLK